MSELPRGWVEIEVREVVQPTENCDPTKEGDSPFRYVDIGSINNRTFSIENPKSLLGREAPSRAKRRIRRGDVLFSTVRTYLKNIAVVPYDLDGEITSTGIAVLRPSDGILSAFLFALVRSEGFIRPLTLKQDGTLYPAITDSDLLNHQIALPPLPEQKRIVAKLEALNGKSARARTELARIETLVSRYKQAVLSKAFAHCKGRSLRLAQLIDADAPIRYGVLQPGSIRDVGVPLVRVCDLVASRVTWAHLRRIEASIDKQFANARIQNGDILLSVVGTIGRLALVEGMTEPTNIARAVARIRPNQSIVKPEWLALRLQANDCQESFSGDAREVARKTLNISMIRAIKLVLPTLEEQHEIVRRIESAFAKIDRLAGEAKRALELVGRLDEAILAKAFRGELVPQDENDEPADRLLARIRAERQAAPKAKRGRGARG